MFTWVVRSRVGGGVNDIVTGAARECIIDWDVIRDAPPHIRGGGLVDVLSIVTGLLDWRYAAERNRNTPDQRFVPWAAGIAAAPYTLLAGGRIVTYTPAGGYQGPDQFPYRVCGTQQDNTAMRVPSRCNKGAILASDCYPVGSSESGHIAVHPRNPDVVFSGAIGSAPGGGGILLRYDHRTGQTRIITAWPEIYGGWGAGDLRYRFQWTYPLLFSRHDPRALYIAAQVVLRSLDEGESWNSPKFRGGYAY